MALDRDPLPGAIEQLAPRMREIATIVYASGIATVRDVHANVEDDVTIYGLRTLLNRLVRRGILRARRSGRHSEIAYLPAIVTERIRAAALNRLVEGEFNGSIQAALITSMRVARTPARNEGQNLQ